MNILLIGINFGIYDSYILEELKNQGHKVTYMHDAVDNYNFLVRILGKHELQKANARYQESKLKVISDEFDEVLVIVGRFLTKVFLSELKERNPYARFILYLWDDVKRVENFNQVKDFYDDIYSFDLKDCQKYGFMHLPLFYKETSNRKQNYDFDIYSALFNHSNRIRIVKDIYLQSIEAGVKTKFILSVGRYDYYFHHRNFINSDGIEYISSPISTSENYTYMRESNAILDIQFSSQIGLTMRTIESIGMNNKIITTNSSVRYYDFYNENNVQIIDRKNPRLDVDYLNRAYIPIDYDIYEKYSIRHWVNTLTGKVQLSDYLGNYKIGQLMF